MNNQQNYLSLNRREKGEDRCQNCEAKTQFPVLEFSAIEMRKGESQGVSHKLTHKNQDIFSVGDKFDGIYIVRSGNYKSHATDREGSLQINGFHLRGEVFGLEGIEGGLYNYNVTSLDTGYVSKIPLDLLTGALADARSLGYRGNLTLSLPEILCQVIVKDQELNFLLRKMNASRRLASFLVDFVDRMQQSGYSSNDLNLCMTRSDIANYLGLAVETISRVFFQLQASEILSIDRRKLKIHDMKALRNLASSSEKPDQNHGSRGEEQRVSRGEQRGHPQYS